MKEFFRSFFAALLAVIVFTILVFMILGGVISGVSKQFEEKEIAVHPNAILDLNLNYLIPEQTQSGLPIGLSWLSFTFDQAVGLNDIVASIKHAETDKNIKGIYLHLGLNQNSSATVQEIRDALKRFKLNSGKFIIAYGEMINQSSYFLGSVADAVYLNPSGSIEFKGMAAQLSFYKGTLDKLGIQTQIFYDGKFKSATEPFRYDKMSDENRLQLREFLDGLFSIQLNQIAESQSKSQEELKTIANDLSLWYAPAAVQSGLIDGLFYEDQVQNEIKLKIGLSEIDSIEKISMHQYAKTFKKNNPFEKTIKEKIAVVYADGTIIDGSGESGYIGSKTFSEMMHAIELDENIKAVVIRVNSPGGSALASDVMWRSIEMVKKNKPVIVSMGNYAASGGYMISCNADYIFAQPNTLTGSIGVFLIIPEISGFMNDKVGITFDTVKTSAYADFPSITRPFQEREKEILQAGVDTTYYRFKKMVADGRKLNIDQVEAIAQGRIWTGTKAKEIGLVDAIGGLDEAIKYAQEKCGVVEYSIVEYPKQDLSFYENIFINMAGETEMKLLSEKLGVLLPQFKTLTQLLEKPVIQTRIPYEIVIY